MLNASTARAGHAAVALGAAEREGGAVRDAARHPPLYILAIMLYIYIYMYT